METYHSMRSILRKYTLLIGCVFAAMAVCNASFAAGNSPRETPHDTVAKASDLMLVLIKETQAQDTQDDANFFLSVTDILDPFVDFTAIARSVMAVHYKRASADQRKAFATSFKGGLVRTYSKALLQFGGGGIQVLEPTAPPRNPKRPTVKMEISTSDGTVYPVSYSMGLSPEGEWKMRNVIINGINIGLTFRNQFAASMKNKKNDMDLVIDGWANFVESEGAKTGANK